MDPDRKLERLCRRHGVPPEAGRRLLPLVRRAVAARPELRRRLLDVVESTLSRDAETLAQRRAQEQQLERQYLIAVASALHGWRPGL